MIKHKDPNITTIKHILTASGNQCAFPNCQKLIFDLEHKTLIGTVAHIKARSMGGPRFDPTQSEEENRNFNNLIAMCAEHSKIIDGPMWKNFSVETLQGRKKDHENKVVKDINRKRIKIPNTIMLMMNNKTTISNYWIDESGRPQLLNSHQLAIINTLMSINMRILGLTTSFETLKSLKQANKNIDNHTIGYTIDKSAISDLIRLFSMVGDITLYELKTFMINSDCSELLEEGTKRLSNIEHGGNDVLVQQYYKNKD